MKNILIIVIIVIILAAGVYYFSQKTAVAPSPAAPAANTPAADTSAKTTAPATNTNTINITIKNFAFTPAELNIKKGDTIVWTNDDSAPHQISGSGIQSEILSKGQSFSFTFGATGTFDYICSLHPSMKGKINVL